MRITFLYILLFLLPSLLSANQGVQVLSSTAQQMTIAFEPQNWQSRQIKAESGIFQEFSFDGAIMQAELGAPQIPVAVLTVGVPNEGDVLVGVVDSEFESKDNINVVPLPQILRQIGRASCRERV